MEWLRPWHSIESDETQVAAMERELRREVTEGHALFGLPVRGLARRQDCDDVLFAIADGTNRVAVVHLTWTQSERLPWPYTVVYSSLESWISNGMLPDHNEFNA